MKENHRSDNKGSFKFSDENVQKIEAQIAKYPTGRKESAILFVLDLAQRQNGGWVSQEAMEESARILSMPRIRVHEVASFYTMFNLSPVGKYHVQLCGTTPCWLRGAADIKKACQRKLGIEEHGITDDGMFSLVEVECLGACVNAPMVQINDDYFEDLTPESMTKILDDLAKGKVMGAEVIPGPQIDRQCAAPVGWDPKQIKTAKTKATSIEPSSKKPVKKKVTDAKQ